MTYIYLLCDATNEVKGIQLAECADHTDAVSKAARTLRPGVSAIEVWHDGRCVGRVDATGGAGNR